MAIATVLVLIIRFRVNAFLALISAAMLVSICSPGGFSDRISRVALAFGTTAGKIGIVIALAAVIGRCLIDSGAADRIVRLFLKIFGEKRCPVSLMSSGFVLSIPVFFDTVFYLLLPLARSMHRRTGKRYVMLILAMGAGASITHSLVPPTPGPLVIADSLGIDLGIMICIGLLLAACTAVVMMFFIQWLSRLNDIPMRSLDGRPEPCCIPDDQLPPLVLSIMPIVLPVILIACNTVTSAWAAGASPDSFPVKAKALTAVVGDANFAMLLSAAIAMVVLCRQRRMSRSQMAETVENALSGAGVIILITSAGGAFGAMLKQAQIGPAIESICMGSTGTAVGGVPLLLMVFFIAFLLKFAQGSSTVAMITTASMAGSFISSAEVIGYHPVYIACAIGFGSQCGNWMNDSGFWIFARMSGLTETETLRTWTVTVSTLAVVGLCFTILFAFILPLV
jgi:GntP family gluconate:H+ symporter